VRWFGALAVLGALTTAAAPAALAQSRPKPELPGKSARDQPVAGKVQVEVMIVHATNSGKVDPRLEDLKRQLNFTRYSGFELLSAHPASLAVGASNTVTVEGGRKLKVTLIERNAESAKVRISLSKNNETKLDTTVRIHRDRVFTVAGPKYQDGVLIFPVSVEY
jgi:hypothetical protein